jgi:hypothetical protein
MRFDHFMWAHQHGKMVRRTTAAVIAYFVLVKTINLIKSIKAKRAL